MQCACAQKERYLEKIISGKNKHNLEIWWEKSTIKINVHTTYISLTKKFIFKPKESKTKHALQICGGLTEVSNKADLI